eukprot:scaffold150670_cov47-Prasinocladus_malaysianus.AAC.1
MGRSYVTLALLTVVCTVDVVQTTQYEQIRSRMCRVLPSSSEHLGTADRQFLASHQRLPGCREPFDLLCSGHVGSLQVKGLLYFAGKRNRLGPYGPSHNREATLRGTSRTKGTQFRMSPKIYNHTGCCKNRENLIESMAHQGFTGWAIELGVAFGSFSKALLEKSSFERVVSVDFWRKRARRYEAMRTLSDPAVAHRACMIWDDFNSALPLFAAGGFDLIYVDGYAKTGEGGSETLRKWFTRIRPGGVLAGHDYDQQWPK